MASYCHPREHSGVPSMRKLAGQSACPLRCAGSFRFEVYQTRSINDAVMFERSETSLFWVVARRLAANNQRFFVSLRMTERFGL